MRKRISPLFRLLTAVALCVGSAGCSNGNDAKEVAKVPKKTSTPDKQAKTVDKKPPTDVEPEVKPDDGAKIVVEKEIPRGDGLLTPDPLDSESPSVPVVQMTEQHAATCLVQVGDSLPAGQLPDLAGESQELSKLLGEKLTVLIFFREGHDASNTAIADLAAGVASPLAVRGVKVIGVCERGSADAVREACKKAGVSYPVLIDADGAYFARLATGAAPRTYLLDNSGKVLWFDVDYSRSTRRDLREALRALVAK